MRTTGQVAVWRADRGWGFIKRDDGLPNIMVHYSNIADTSGRYRSLLEGEIVEFDVASAACSDASEGGSDRVEAVRVTGPRGAPVVGQPGASNNAGAPRWHAVQTVSPGAPVQAASAPAQSKASCAFVPRSVSRAATCATDVPE